MPNSTTVTSIAQLNAAIVAADSLATNAGTVTIDFANNITLGAFGPDLPRRDLFLSPDHAVYLRGVLIPIRLLINGRTIAQVPVDKVTWYHVELSRHDVLLAEGLPAESYLDTGNRGMFENGGRPPMLHPDMAEVNDQARREAESCAPLVCDPAGVEPIWRSLAERAADLGMPPSRLTTTNDPEPRIVAGGRSFTPISRSGGQYTFVVPGISRGAHLVSRAAVPSEARPWIDDQRRLGMFINRIVIRCGPLYREIAMDDPRLASGWWQPERAQSSIGRWTDGNALLPFDCDPGVIEVGGGMTLPYPIRDLAEEPFDAAGVEAALGEYRPPFVPRVLREVLARRLPRIRSAHASA